MHKWTESHGNFCARERATSTTTILADAPPGLLSVQQAATAIVDGLEREQFLLLTHPEVLGYFQRKASDYDRWLAGMRRIRDALRSGPGFLKVRSRR